MANMLRWRGGSLSREDERQMGLRFYWPKENMISENPPHCRGSDLADGFAAKIILEVSLKAFLGFRIQAD